LYNLVRDVITQIISLLYNPPNNILENYNKLWAIKSFGISGQDFSGSLEKKRWNMFQFSLHFLGYCSLHECLQNLLISS
ncbi:hypothetical protein ACJX0J_015720, partial [Zea mays]